MKTTIYLSTVKGLVVSSIIETYEYYVMLDNAGIINIIQFPHKFVVTVT